MSFPVQAFVKEKVSNVPQGALVLVRGFWSIRTRFDTPNGPKQNIVFLNGEVAGNIHVAPDDYGIAVSRDYSVEFRVASSADIQRNGEPPQGVSIVIASDSPEVWGHIAGAPEHRYGFKLNGDPLENEEEHDNHPFYKAGAFKAWLMKDGKQVGAEPLFTVGAQ